MIYSAKDMETRATLDAAARMCAAARTAPKTKGMDGLVTCVVTGEEKEQLADELHSAPKAQNADRIYLPGEMEWDKRTRAEESGEIEITDAMAESYKKLSELTGVKIELGE